MDWTEVLTAGGVVVAVVAAYFTYRTARPPKREVTIAVLPAVALLDSPSLARLGIGVTWEGRALDDPRLATVTVTTTGTHDVPAAAFDGGAPLVIDVGTPIEVVDATHPPERVAPLPCVASGTELRVGPGLLARGDRIVVQLLTQGAPADPPRVRHALVDVRVTLDAAPAGGRPVAAAAFVLVTFLLMVASVVGLVAGPDLEPRLVVSKPAVRRGGEFALAGVHLAEYCPVEVRVYDRLVARGQTDGDGVLNVVVHVAKDAPLGKTDVHVRCGDRERSVDYRTSIAIVRDDVAVSLGPPV